MSRKKNLEAREKILQTAIRLFHERGFKGVSMDDVADAAALKKANLFYYYPTKETLALAAVDYATERLRNKVRSQCQGNGSDPIRTVAKIFSDSAAGMRAAGCCRGCFVGNLAQELSDHNEKLRAKISEYFQFWALQLSESLESAQMCGYFSPRLKPRESAEALLSLLEGALLFCKASKRISALENAGKMAVDYLEAYRA